MEELILMLRKQTEAISALSDATGRLADACAILASEVATFLAEEKGDEAPQQYLDGSDCGG